MHVTGLCLHRCIMCQLIRLGAVLYKHWASSGFLSYNSMGVTGLCLSHCIMCQLIRLGAVLCKHWASSGFLPYNRMDVTGLCLSHCIMCQLIRAQWSCFTNGCSIYVCGRDLPMAAISVFPSSGRHLPSRQQELSPSKLKQDHKI